MLRELVIENVAVIEKATVAFNQGFNVLTGETGAGKSVLINSINAILGSRVSKDIIRNGTDKASIWAVFENITNESKCVLEETGYKNEDQLIVQREIYIDGKSTCRINGKMATATVLREVCSSLINVHGQHDNQNLLDSTKHIIILDNFARNAEIINQYKKEFRILVSIEKQIKALSIDETEKEQKQELLTYQISEIEKADLIDTEEETLEKRKITILNSKKILEGLSKSYECLGNQEGTALDLLSVASNALQTIQSFSDDVAILSDKMNELYFSAQEMAINIKNSLDELYFDETEIDEVENRLDLIYKLKRKYGKNIKDILAFYENAKKEFENITYSQEHLDELLEKRDVLYERVKVLANKVTKSRETAFEKLSKELNFSLEFLNMNGIVFSLKHTKGTLTINGQDTIEFYIITNAGESAKPLSKIASGGELSRIMLAIKNTLAESDLIDTVIYDEIDTGISGMAAGRIGKVLKNSSKGKQVICVTHTAQIASCAESHLLIKKTVDNGRTFTTIDPLLHKERVSEIARIISGDQVTELSLASAEEMLSLMC